MKPHLRLALPLSFTLFAMACGTADRSEPTVAAVAASDKVLLKTQVAYASSLPGLGTPLVRLADKLSQASSGRLVMRIYEPGELVNPSEILDVVSTGKVDAGYCSAGYWAGKIPAAPLFSSVPFGPEAGEYMAWLYFGNGRKLHQEMFDQAGYHVHAIPCVVLAPETSGWFAKEINNQQDLQGLKMRFFGLGGDVMQKLGVATSLLPGGEIFPALEQGALDATEFSMPSVDERLGFHRLVKYNYFPGWHQQASIIDLLINQVTWDALSPDLQVLIEMACQAQMTESFAEGEASQFQAMRKNTAEHGVQLKDWSPEMLKLFRETWNEVVAEQVAADPFFAKVWNDLEEFRDGYVIWKEHAFLPRR
ncbi:MAG: TRAP transporter substrate-binding protein [Planctomycetales bacterium]|nr:TRAP transporter substrate-binding protein [Planctomycetales bacterium]